MFLYYQGFHKLERKAGEQIHYFDYFTLNLLSIKSSVFPNLQNICMLILLSQRVFVGFQGGKKKNLEK